MNDNDNIKFIYSANNILESYSFFFFHEKKKHYFEMIISSISIKYKFKIHRQVGNKKNNLQIQYLQYVSNLSILFINAETDIHNVRATSGSVLKITCSCIFMSLKSFGNM